MTRTEVLANASWRKSSYSSGSGDNCVEVADGFTGLVPVRDSKDPSVGTLLVSGGAWTAFVALAKATPTV